MGWGPKWEAGNIARGIMHRRSYGSSLIYQTYLYLKASSTALNTAGSWLLCRDIRQSAAAVKAGKTGMSVKVTGEETSIIKI